MPLSLPIPSLPFFLWVVVVFYNSLYLPSWTLSSTSRVLSMCETGKGLVYKRPAQNLRIRDGLPSAMNLGCSKEQIQNLLSETFWLCDHGHPF